MIRKAQPPAKINLGLWIHERREDGFHDLSTLFQEIPLRDRLAFDPSGPRETTGTSYGPENITERARDALEKACGRPLSGSFILDKSIPAEAGLGGGSSDGAWALRLLNETHGLDFNDDELEKIAARFGSDTSFFIQGGCQLGRGRGDDLATVTPYSGLVLLAVPEFGLSTARVFGELRRDELTPDQGGASMIQEALTSDPTRLDDLLHNTLTAPAARLEPRLFPFLDDLSGLAGSRAHMSGSGSSCFALPTKAPERPGTWSGRLLTLLDCGSRRQIWEVRS